MQMPWVGKTRRAKGTERNPRYLDIISRVMRTNAT